MQGVIATAQANGFDVLSVMDYGCLSVHLPHQGHLADRNAGHERKWVHACWRSARSLSMQIGSHGNLHSGRERVVSALLVMISMNRLHETILACRSSATDLDVVHLQMCFST